HPLPLTEHGNHLIEDGVKVHRGSSYTGGGQYGLAAAHGPQREATYYMYCKAPAKESRKEGARDPQEPRSHRDGAWCPSPRPHTIPTVQRSALCLQPHDAHTNTPKPDDVVIAQRRSASRVTAARRNTPPRPSSRPSMTWGCLTTS